jgi:hypothetical protein
MRRTEEDAASPVGPPARRSPTSRPLRRLLGMASVGVALTLSGCGLHVSKSGVSGNILGHSFSVAKGSLPAGFPSAVPTPDSSRVLGGGGADNRWGAVFAVTGTITSGTAAYQSKLSAAGYAITNTHSGSTPVTAATDSGSTATTVTVTGVSFQASDPQWTIQVVSGNTSSIRGTVLKAGEFAISLVVGPTSASTTSSP